MVIDFHTHIFPDELAAKAVGKLKEHAPGANNFTDGTGAGLVASMKMAGIDRSCTLPIATKPEQVDTINRACVAQRVEGLIPFGTIHPNTVDIDGCLDMLVQGRVKGVKLHPEYQDFYIDDKRYFPMYEALSSRGLVAVFHAGKDPGPFSSDHANPPALRHVHRSFPHLIIVASHMGGWQLWPEVETELTGLPIYFDTSATSEYLDKEQFVRLARKQGIERILFGTDSPWFDQKDEVEWIKRLPLKDSEIEMILGGNAAKMLDI